MGQDNPFLQAILDHPDDDTPRLVYADWLEERGESMQAEFLRLECRLARWAITDAERALLLKTLQRLQKLLDNEWLRRLGIRTIFAERTKNPFWSLHECVAITGREARQSGGRGSYAVVSFRIGPLPGKTAVVLEDKAPCFLSVEYAGGVVAGVREGLRTHTVAGKVLGSLRMEWIEGRYMPVDSSQESFRRAAVLALTHADFVGQLVRVAQS